MSGQHYFMYNIVIYFRFRNEEIRRCIASFKNRKSAFICFTALRGIINMPDVGFRIISSRKVPFELLDEVLPKE